MFSYLYELPSYVYVFVIRIAFLGMFLVYVCLSAIMFACQYFSLSFHIFVLYALQFTDAGLLSLLGLLKSIWEVLWVRIKILLLFSPLTL